MKFKTQVITCFGIIYGIYAIFSVYHWTGINNYEQAIKNYIKSYTLLNLSYSIQEGLNEYSKESRELFENPSSELKEQFTKKRDLALQNVNKAIDAHLELDGSKKSKDLVNALKNNIETYSDIEKKKDELLKEGKTEEVNQLYWNQGREVSDTMIELSSQLYAIQDEMTKNKLIQSSGDYTKASNVSKIYIISDYFMGSTLLSWILWNVTRRLNKVSSVMEQVNFNNLEKLPRINMKTKDEIGKIAVSFNEMAEALEVHTRHEKELKTTAEEQSWLKTKVAEFATMYSGIDDLETLGHLFITKLTPTIGANYGLFYIKQRVGDDEILQKIATYAYNHQKLGADHFRLGEGLVGQCALENRMIVLNQVPNNYIKITSGTGMASPSDVLIIPVEYQGEVLSVIELASFKSFSHLEQLLLKEVIRNLGINIQSILRHMQVESLLKESQALTEELQSQSEELQSQQEELRIVNEQIETQYENAEKKTRELENVQSILEEKAKQLTLSSQYKSEFLANMSHELRTPLNSLLILAQMLAENANGNLTPKQVNYADTIFSSGNDLLHLINDILDLSKVEAGKMEITMNEVKLSDVKKFVESQFTPVARKKNIQFNIQLDPTLPTFIHTDTHRLQQILKNLLSNAFKFTNQGTVSLAIRKVEKGMFSKQSSFTHSDIELAFSVKDTGIGIPSENHDIIFDAFKQADGTINRKYGGTGLGLSISQEISRLLGGFIEVESIEGDGSTFTLYLPNNQNLKRSGISLSEAEIATGLLEDSSVVRTTSVVSPLHGEGARKQVHDGKALLEGKKVLVVDDDMRNIFALTTALESYHVEVVFAENGREGIATLQNNSDIDLILMYIMMPEMDGFEAIQFIRQIPEFQSIPIIALTAKAMKYDRNQCIEAGASDYISKPVNLEQLISIMRVWLYR
ncbi:hybrid sensor histidine kinase/response regulator [Bacillus cihuensis]|uniref:hybrid sensor histidine kinase/response regulator n=1 Tax=Bacillus cihuensis TaxID=1208599 RepID=UPI0004087F27|nr:ATP-binding protein [Bacillus cihuensis]